MITRTEKIAGLQAIVGTLDSYAENGLYIADKSGVKRKFIFNQAQREIHAKLEQQLRDTGKVRAIVLKARQMGISSYIAARLYHKVTTAAGKRALIVGHEQRSTDALFQMVRYFQNNSRLGISLGYTNAKELIFDKLGSGYRTATAGTQDVGRGSTSQYAHLSELAYWAEGQRQLAGLGNTVADIPGTEILIESTANGIGNAFFTLWQDAESGKNDWLPVFLPWFVMPEYRARVTNLQLSPEDEQYMNAYGLDLEQMQWRANKLSTYGEGYEYLWSREYPACASEAFAIAGGNSLINPTHVMAAINSKHLDERAPLVIGCDPAGDGTNDADRTAIAFRRGRMIFRIESHQGLNTMQIAGKLAEYNQEFAPDRLFVDKGGLGAGVFDRLNELNVPVVGINSATRANDPERYENRRAEMWWTMKEWFEDQPCRIPNNAALISDLTAPQPRVSSNGRKLLEKKEDMKRRQVRSPDLGDAAALCFAEPVVYRAPVYVPWRASRGPATSAGY